MLPFHSVALLLPLVLIFININKNNNQNEARARGRRAGGASIFHLCSDEPKNKKFTPPRRGGARGGFVFFK
jgi:hypothetical protein